MFLFICMTNLQLLIAKAIIEKEGLNNVELLFIGDAGNGKNLCYLNKIKPFCQHVSIEGNAKKTSILKTLKRTLYAKKIMMSYNKRYDIVFFANFHVPLIHHILSVISFNEIRTFDDGTNNINKESVMYLDSTVSFTAKHFRKLMGRKYHKEDVLNLDKIHYTLFPEKSNIIEKKETITLICYNSENSGTGVVKKILLGTVYSDAIDKKNEVVSLIHKVQSFIDTRKIDYYIPHPREMSHRFDNVENINSELIAEDIILLFLKQGLRLELYGFNTTTQINLSNISSIENYNLKSPLLKQCFNHHLGFDFNDVEL
ncbi:TPA: UDP-glucose--glucosyl LPS a 1, 2-glucosyltransferase [Citrobacter farmeri]|uniref:UDP-glucose--glucosyl LPS a 1, 2-glucosyltransferase n=1 Tax=Citrobacter farmeri TaxID=67824 RepID=A0ACA8D0Q6_9ENTR|nr:UDP-glucose--glucosyl LPS a 1, 2-glucosyltransferase [Citrobacter farmeri]GAL50549.1 lipopolysaccharide 1,2-glucosyltransferase [Citrobacter farmeri GTC 1319]HAT2168142.1 UDP-glucose--glucosyl LPS a 1, 2-glucosyltransferase [Citrobacter freundii]EMB4693588.1 UDP-glucose--glucosyl LPS a 1, 2-glucosyltransferase [Citrobacter farmeri]MCW2422030.1 beta-galactosamide-alpha-2,3-sialyltransferase [Citrobacter farmeri]